VSWIWCDGAFQEGPLAVSPADRGLTCGLGLFETLLAVDGAAVALDLHLARMTAGAARLGWAVDFNALTAALPELLQRCDLTRGRARVRIALTAGAGELRDIGLGNDSRLWMTAAPCPLPPASMSLVTAPFPRHERSPLAGLKCASYAENLIALDHARRAGADEALFLNTRGALCEAATANLFLVKSGRVLTPPLSSGCLPGTMRQRVMQAVRVTEVDLTEAALAEADELFLSSATRGVVPVLRVDGRSFPAGVITAEIARHPACYIGTSFGTPSSSAS
jgi:branched-subunit amino acid aminotransferase/4-amino-4-deoxychorismate lyase